MEAKVNSTNNKFLKLNLEKKEFNQYWFSEKTIAYIINQIQKHYEIFKNNLLTESNTENNYKIAIICCPSVFFSLDKQMQEISYLFDIDEKLVGKHKNGVCYNFNDCEELKKTYENQFNYLLIDPPFVVKETWEKFSDFAKCIMKKDSKILTCSLFENSELLSKLLDLKLKKFQPSIPHLVYQYNFYSNYDDESLNLINEELNIS
jgi:hypothetical protein